MNEEITASTTLDSQALAPAYRWHGRRRRWRSWMQWPLAAVLVFAAVWVRAASKGETVKPFVFLLAFAATVAFAVTMAAIQSYVLKRSIAKSIQNMPAYGKSIAWTMKENGVAYSLGDSHSFIAWPMVFESVVTPDGALLYPQKGLFLWLPKTAFTSEGGYQRFLELITAKTKHSQVG